MSNVTYSHTKIMYEFKLCRSSDYVCTAVSRHHYKVWQASRIFVRARIAICHDAAPSVLCSLLWVTELDIKIWARQAVTCHWPAMTMASTPYGGTLNRNTQKLEIDKSTLSKICFR